MARQVNREEFKAYFNDALNVATAHAEKHFRVRVNIPKHQSVELHGAGHDGGRIAPDVAADALYLGPERFYKLIDVLIKWIEGDTAVRSLCSPASSPARGRRHSTPVD
ncbi:MAG TPA: hypothetical protein VI056_05125 [Candidatus Limnocylindria bacterium]